MKLRLPPSHVLKKFVRFVGLSVASFALTLGLTSLFVEIVGLGQLVSHAMTLVCVFAVNFLMLVYFVFPNGASRPANALVLFLMSTLIFRGSEWLVYALLVKIAHLNYQLAIIIIVPFFAVAKFVVLHLFIFNKSPDDVAHPISPDN